MKNFKVVHPANFKDKLIVNLHLSFPVRWISRGIVIGIVLTRNQLPLDGNDMKSGENDHFFNFASHLNKLVLGNLHLRKTDYPEHVNCIKRQE